MIKFVSSRNWKLHVLAVRRLQQMHLQPKHLQVYKKLLSEVNCPATSKSSKTFFCSLTG